MNLKDINFSDPRFWALRYALLIFAVAFAGELALNVVDTHCTGFIHKLNAKIGSNMPPKQPAACVYP